MPDAPASSLAGAADAYLNAQVQRGQFSGTILIAQTGTVLVSAGYDLANREHRVPNTPTTRFRLASLTKPFTALAILMLHQQGKLHVHAPLGSYLASCPATWAPITIHQLLSHTAGIPNAPHDPNLEPIAVPVPPEQLIARVKDRPLDFVPGSQWAYSNAGYQVLGFLIELVSGQDYATFLQQQIFVPLGMRHTGYDHPQTIVPDRAAGYAERDGLLINAPYRNMSVPYAAGGLYSTVGDLYLWNQALYTEQLVPQSMLERMFTSAVAISSGHSAVAAYGYGWFIGMQFQRRFLSHEGGIAGFRTYFGRYPEEQVLIVVLSNLERTIPWRIAQDLSALIFEEATPRPAE